MEENLAANLKTHVVTLAEQIGERHVPDRDIELEQAADYIERTLRRTNLQVRSMPFEVRAGMVRNIEGIKPGGRLADEIIVIGAHYDSAPGTPGANDNGSGVAVLLELARMVQHRSFDRTVRFVAFVNEEPPYFHTDNMGSWQYAQECRRKELNVVAMLALETVGYYSDQPGSQQYPPLLRAMYPDVGNFVAFVGNLGSKWLVKRCVKTFRDTTAFPSEGAALPGWLTGVDWSDHWSFWEAGYDGIMVTDTAIFRYPHYHEPEDTPDKIDFTRTALVTQGILQVLQDLATNPL